MKKWFFLAIIGILLAASCSEKETNDKPDVLNNTMWYFSPHASTYQYKYTNKFKKFCRDYNNNREFDESVHNFDTIVYFSYWWFHWGKMDYFWQYQDGRISEGSTTYTLGDGYIKTVSGNYYDILSVNKKRLIVQYTDTTFFYDEDYERQVAYVETRTYRFNNQMENDDGKNVEFSARLFSKKCNQKINEVVPDTDKGSKK